MGTTAAGLRFPEPTDRVADGATAIRNLATDVTALARGQLVRAVFDGAERTSGTTVNAYADVLSLDFTMPASVPSNPTGQSRLLLLACYDGLWTGGAGGPNVRWLLNGAQAGQVRTSSSPQNIYTSATHVDYVNAPAAGSAVTLRYQYATGATTAVKIRLVLGVVLLV